MTSKDLAGKLPDWLFVDVLERDSAIWPMRFDKWASVMVDIAIALSVRPEWLAFGSGRMSTKFAGPWSVQKEYDVPTGRGLWVSLTDRSDRRIFLCGDRNERHLYGRKGPAFEDARRISGKVVRVGTRKAKNKDAADITPAPPWVKVTFAKTNIRQIMENGDVKFTESEGFSLVFDRLGDRSDRVFSYDEILALTNRITHLGFRLLDSWYGYGYTYFNTRVDRAKALSESEHEFLVAPLGGKR